MAFERRTRSILLVVVVLLSICPPASADAPLPIRDRDLTTYSRILGLSESQQTAISTHHRTYVTNFDEQFRDRIEELNARHREVGDTPIDVPDPETIARYHRYRDRLYRDVAALDTAFFNEWRPLLTDEQSERLAAVQQYRTRTRLDRHRDLHQWLRLIRDHDILLRLEELDLPAEQYDRAITVLMTEQAAHTRHIRRLADLAAQHMTTWRSLVDERGFDPEAPPHDGAVISLKVRAWQDASEDAKAALGTYVQYRRQLLDRFTSVMDEPHAHHVRVTMAEAWAPQIIPPGFSTRKSMLAAWSIDFESDAQRERTRSLIRRFIEDDRRYLRRSMDVLDEYAGQRIPQFMSPSDERERDAALSRIAEEREAIDQQYLDELATQIGPEQFRAVDAREVDDPEESASQGAETAQRTHRRDHSLPRPFDRAALERFADNASLTEDQRHLLDDLFEDYRASYGELQRGVINEAASMVVGFRSSGEENGSRTMRYTPPENSVRRLELRQQAVREIRSLDAQLLYDLKTVLFDGKDATELIRLRIRRAHDFLIAERPPHQSAAFTEHQADLLDVIDNVGPSEEMRHQALAILREHASDLERLYLAHHQATMQFQFSWSMRWAIAAWDLNNEERVRALHDEHRAAADSLSNLRKETADLHRTILAQLMDNTPHAANDIERRYQQSAFPAVFERGDHAATVLRRALDLPNLSAEQRSKLHDLMIEHREADEKLINRKIELIASCPYAGVRQGRSREVREEMDALQQLFSRLRGQRSDLAARTLRQIEQILTNHQKDALGL